MKKLAFVWFLLWLTVSPLYALPADSIGHIQTLRGTASIIQGVMITPAAVGTLLYRGDLIRTGKPGAVGIVLTDDTTISLGPDSELNLKDYAFDPKEKKFSLVARLVKGTFVYLSGLIGKLAPDSVQLAIPDAIISIRGTKVLVAVEQ